MFLFSFLIILFKSMSRGRCESSMVVTRLTNANFNEILRDTVSIIVAHVPWCGNCRKFIPKYTSFANELSESVNRIQFVSVNCEIEIVVCRYLNIEEYPQIIGMVDGQRHDESLITFHGIRSKLRLTEWIMAHDQRYSNRTDLQINPFHHDSMDPNSPIPVPLSSMDRTMNRFKVFGENYDLVVPISIYLAGTVTGAGAVVGILFVIIHWT